MPIARRPDVVGVSLTYPSGTRVDPHTHPAHQILHATSGTMRVAVAGALWFLPLGRALWIPAEVEHAIVCQGAVTMQTAYFSEPYPDVPVEVRLIAVSALLRELLVHLADEPDEEPRRLFGDLILHHIGRRRLEPLRLPIPVDPRIAALAASLQADPSSDTPLTAWAKRLGLSERSLIRRIREETGLTFRELRRQTRIMVAIECLTQGQPATRVALDVGFETPSAFIQAFRAVTGKTPRRFIAGQ